MTPTGDIVGWVRSAQGGDSQAWDRLVAEFTPSLRRAIRGYGLRHHDVEDALQVTWMRAWTRIGSLQEPAAIAGWLITTARRSAIRIRTQAVREVLVDEPIEDDNRLEATLEDQVILAERASALRCAVGRLPRHQRTVVEALLAGHVDAYRRIADELGVPIGGIGPTRARSLARLRDDSVLALALGA